MTYGISNQCDGRGWVEAGETLEEAIVAGQRRYALDDCDSFFVAEVISWSPTNYVPSAQEVFDLFYERIDDADCGRNGRGASPTLTPCAEDDLRDALRQWANKHYRDLHNIETCGDIDEVDIVRAPK